MNQREKIDEFFERLERLDAGGRARLKRNAGNSLPESRGALGLFYNLLPPGVPAYQEETYFMAATLYPLAESGGPDNLGASLRQARTKDNARGLDRRVEILLDADEAQLSFRLRQAVRFLHSRRVGVDWPRLLQDLLRWNSPKRYVQENWARAYFTD